MNFQCHKDRTHSSTDKNISHFNSRPLLTSKDSLPIFLHWSNFIFLEEWSFLGRKFKPLCNIAIIRNWKYWINDLSSGFVSGVMNWSDFKVNFEIDESRWLRFESLVYLSPCYPFSNWCKSWNYTLVNTHNYCGMHFYNRSNVFYTFFEFFISEQFDFPKKLAACPS